MMKNRDIIKQKAGFLLIDNIENYYLNSNFAKSIYPEGRTTRSLCVNCNSFLGKYDEDYLKFFNLNGDPHSIKGFTDKTKLQIVKAVFGKFLSLPEAIEEKFDFTNFLLDKQSRTYNGVWKLYFIKRDSSTNLFFSDIQTFKSLFDEGVMYILSDEKFIFHLMNFEKDESDIMNDIFDIFNKDYKLVVGTEKNGGYYAQALMAKILEDEYHE